MSGAAKSWHDDVVLISAGGANEQRREAVQSRLSAIGLAMRAVPFEGLNREGVNRQGVNLLAEVAGAADAPLLLLGAHYDKVDVGQGATDNASGVAAVLTLAERFRRTPLQRHRVAVAFWDLEEGGLLGSGAYVSGGGAKPAMYVNFDVLGWGDTLWMMSPDAEAPLAAASRRAAQGRSLDFVAGEKYPPTDHLSFQKAAWPAVSYSFVGRDEIPLILEAFAGRKPDGTAKVLRVIHSPADTLEEVDATAVARGVDAVEAALRAWDAGSAIR